MDVHDQLIFHVGKVITERIPDGLQALAVTAPKQVLNGMHYEIWPKQRTM